MRRAHNFKDLAGQQFGKLTVLKLHPVRAKAGSTRWLCQCECGRRPVIWIGDLKKAKSCGCGRDFTRRIDLTGQRFGRWTALEFFRSPSRWRCRCDCGTVKLVRTLSLKRAGKAGGSMSCGCLDREQKLKHGLTGTREIGRWYANQRRARLLGAGGSHTMDEVRALWLRQAGLCAHCHADLSSVKAELDHIVSLSRGGSNSIENLQWLCKPCNRTKHARPLSYLQRRRPASGEAARTKKAKARPPAAAVMADKQLTLFRKLLSV